MYYWCAGHTDVVMGAVILNDDKVAAQLRFLQNGKQFGFIMHAQFGIFAVYESVLLYESALIDCFAYLFFI